MEPETVEGQGTGRASCAVLASLAVLTLAACATAPRHLDAATQGAPTSRYGGYKVGKPYEVKGVWYTPQEQPSYDEIGIASWYGEQFHNHYTADGEVFDMGLPSAAHKTLPLPSLVEVTNLANGRTLIVRVNDRGPFVDGRVIDMSKAAAEELGFVAAGVTRVRVRYVGQASAPPEPRLYQAANDLAKRAMPKAPMPKLQFKFAAPPLPLAEVPTPPMVLAAAPMPVVTPSIQFFRPAAVAQAPLPPVAAVEPPAPALADVDSLLSGAAPPAQAAEAVQAASAAGNYQLQAGVFANRLNAEALASRLGDVGAPNVEPFERNGQTLYRVVVRGFANPSAAAAAQTQAVSLGVRDAQVIAGAL